MPTQKEVAEHLGISQQAVSEQLRQLNLIAECCTMDQIRLAYIARLREQASGHSNVLAIERAKTERVDREIKLLTLEEKRKTLVRIEVLKPMLSAMLLSFRNELRSLPQKIALEIETNFGVQVDAEKISEKIDDALRKLSQYDPGGGGSLETSSAVNDASGEDQYDRLGEKESDA